MKHTINETYTKYHVEKLPFASLTDSRTLKDGFAVRIGLKALPRKGERRVLSEIGGTLKIVCGTLCFPDDYGLLDGYKRAEGYDVYADNDGVSPYIEAEIKLYQQYGNENVRSMTLGLPLKLFDASKKDIFLLYD